MIWRPAALAVLSFFATWVIVVMIQELPAVACAPGDPSCVTVAAGAPGSPGRGANTPPRAGGTGSKQDPCAADPNSAACAAENQARMCSAAAADWAGGSLPGGPIGTLRNLSSGQVAELNQSLAADGCPPYSTGGVVIDPAILAQRAADSFLLPEPSGHRSPSEAKSYNGYPVTYINLWTFYWTDPGTWKSLTATARAGASYATVTATPVSLTFDPGNGSPAVSCAGPGRPWTTSDGNSAPTDGACGYRYTTVSGPGYDHPVASTQTITWQLTWTGSNNTSGILTQRTTSTTGRLNVLQIQTVNK